MSYSEEEQLESIKRFWNDHGTPILVGVSLALAIFAGWRYWTQSQLQTASLAANTYQQVLDADQQLTTSAENKTANTDLQKNAQKLIQDYATTPYAVNAALLLAKQAMNVNDTKTAEKHLRWVLEQKIDDGMKSLATLRLAEVLAEKADTKGALALLAQDSNPAFTPSREELKGDLLKASGDIAGARTAYQAAAKALIERKEPRPLLELKMADVGLEAPEIKQPSPIREEQGAANGA